MYTFVYVPEGYVPNVEDNDSVDEMNEDNIRVIQQYTHAIGSIDSKILVNQFISGMPDRDEVLNQFREGRIQVIASMKCLDEGVDIPHRLSTPFFVPVLETPDNLFKEEEEF
ncbi:MAG: hypothetical protein U5L96_17615 [Owenweeksia sp.]|nr:hypothetical protein [Owenweeksia sp.]